MKLKFCSGSIENPQYLQLGGPCPHEVPLEDGGPAGDDELLEETVGVELDGEGGRVGLHGGPGGGVVRPGLGLVGADVLGESHVLELQRINSNSN